MGFYLLRVTFSQSSYGLLIKIIVGLVDQRAHSFADGNAARESWPCVFVPDPVRLQGRKPAGEDPAWRQRRGRRASGQGVENGQTDGGISWRMAGQCVLYAISDQTNGQFASDDQTKTHPGQLRPG